MQQVNKQMLLKIEFASGSGSVGSRLPAMEIFPSFEEFERNWGAGKNQTLSISLPANGETSLSLFQKLGQGRPFSFLLESADESSGRRRYSIIGIEPDLIWRCERDGTATTARRVREE
jgi:anthranilate synthase component I